MDKKVIADRLTAMASIFGNEYISLIKCLKDNCDEKNKDNLVRALEIVKSLAVDMKRLKVELNSGVTVSVKVFDLMLNIMDKLMNLHKSCPFHMKSGPVIGKDVLITKMTRLMVLYA